MTIVYGAFYFRQWFWNYSAWLFTRVSGIYGWVSKNVFAFVWNVQKIDIFVNFKRRFLTLLRHGLRNWKKSIAYIRLDVQMIPCSSKKPYQLNFMTQKRFNCQHFNVPGLRWSGFESHIWLMNLIKAKNEIDFEFGSDFHNQMWSHKNSILLQCHLFHYRHVPRQKSAFYLVIWFNSRHFHVHRVQKGQKFDFELTQSLLKAHAENA